MPCRVCSPIYLRDRVAFRPLRQVLNGSKLPSAPLLTHFSSITSISAPGLKPYGASAPLGYLSLLSYAKIYVLHLQEQIPDRGHGIPILPQHNPFGKVGSGT